MKASHSSESTFSSSICDRCNSNKNDLHYILFRQFAQASDQQYNEWYIVKECTIGITVVIRF
jgi:hypothetical protein